jgi:hypothetical protein
VGKTYSTHGGGKEFTQYLEWEPQWKRPLGKCENLKNTNVINLSVREDNIAMDSLGSQGYIL